MRKTLLILVVCSTGCDMPHDPDGTYHRVRDGILRAGITNNQPWTKFTDGEATGIEVQLLNQFARQLQSTIRWTQGSESQLFELLKSGELDVMIGGLDESTPWAKDVDLTQCYLETPDIKTGQTRHLVWATPRGENRWTLEIDRFLQGQRANARKLLSEAQR